MILNKIALIVPTRERPDQVHDQADAFKKLTGPYADIHYVVDGDHGNEHAYSRAVHDYPVHYQPWRGLSGTLNTSGVSLAQRYRYVGFVGDDHMPMTDQWDGLIFNTFALPETLIVYGPDGQPKGTGSYPALTWWVMDSDLILHLGQMVPFVLSHTCVDDYVAQLGYQSNTIVYDPDVLFEHNHWIWDKGVVDASYERSSEHNNRLADNKKWLDYQEIQLPRDIAIASRLR